MDAEREALQSTAFPEVQTFCQKHGLMFEVVDLRWGIRSSEATDHMTTELCLEELDRCRKTSIGPAFVVSLLGAMDWCLLLIPAPIHGSYPLTKPTSGGMWVAFLL
uniref:Uncharacterized protein n=1 Tax=Neovison vison TaxID=452646 RepID=A0A8C7ESG3_NEOVI